MLATFPVSKELFSNLSFLVDVEGKEAQEKNCWDDKNDINLLDWASLFEVANIFISLDIFFPVLSANDS